MNCFPSKSNNFQEPPTGVCWLLMIISSSSGFFIVWDEARGASDSSSFFGLEANISVY